MNQEAQSPDHAPDTSNSDFGVDSSVYNMGEENVEAPEAGASEGQAVDGVAKAKEEPVLDPESIFELSKEVALKPGDQLTPEHIKELRRAALRESDYTRKTQELSQIRTQAQEALQARDAVLQNPQALRQFLNDDHILKAFHPHELLVAGLQSNGIPHDVWNRFLEEFQQSGGQAQNNWQANPVARDLHQTKAEMMKLQNRLQSFEQMQTRSVQERAEQEAKIQLQTEVSESVKKYPDVTEEEILEAIAAGRPGTAEQIAAMISKRYNERISKRDKALLEQSKRQKQTAPKGTSVPVLPKRPTTWDEASAAANAYLSGAQQT